MAGKFKRITEDCTWCYIDELEDVPLKSGEKLQIKWPDGSVTTEKIDVQKWNETVCDMGHDVDIPHSKATVEVKVRGKRVDVEICGLMAERVGK